MKESRCFPNNARIKLKQLKHAKFAKALLPQILKIEKFLEGLIDSVKQETISLTPNNQHLIFSCYSRVVRLRKGLEILTLRPNKDLSFPRK